MVAGWGNFGGAVAQGLIGTILFPAFRTYYGSSERAWRVVCVIPAALAFTCGAILPFVSDDAPMGNFAEMKRRGTADRVLFTTSMRSAAVMNTWILYVQYACCFGVELVMTNASVLYFTHEFGMNTEQAATFGFIYGSMNLFARGLGGFCSDKINLKFGLRGRLYLTTILLVCQGTFVLIFPFASTLSGAVVTMCIFSVFTKAAEGSIFGTVPYVRKLYTGAGTLIVGR
jgi:NNP family nitrate/nitrite transporter-like MFS transporter